MAAPLLQPQVFRKKPVFVSAVRFDGSAEQAQRILDWVAHHQGVAGQRGHFRASIGSEPAAIFLPVRGDVVRADAGDWIVQGMKPDFFYPAAPEFFAQTYELA